MPYPITAPDQGKNIRESVVQEESILIKDLQNVISKKVVDLEMMANFLVEKDNTSSNQISTRDIEGCLKTVGLELDKSMMSRLVKLTETKRNHCSIPHIIKIIKNGTNPSENETGLGRFYYSFLNMF